MSQEFDGKNRVVEDDSTERSDPDKDVYYDDVCLLPDGSVCLTVNGLELNLKILPEVVLRYLSDLDLDIEIPDDKKDEIIKRIISQCNKYIGTIDETRGKVNAILNPKDLFEHSEIVKGLMRKKIAKERKEARIQLQNARVRSIQEIDKTYSLKTESELDSLNDEERKVEEARLAMLSEAERVNTDYDPAKWAENPLAIAEDDMEKCFKSKYGSPDFLTTYFNSATFGLALNLIEEIAKRRKEELDLDNDPLKFPRFLTYFKKKIINRLEPYAPASKGGSGFFQRKIKCKDKVNPDNVSVDIPDNVFFTDGGTSGGQKILESCVRKGSKVLVTDQEFEAFTELCENKEAQLVRCPKYNGNDEDFEKAIRNKIKETPGGIDFMLISDIGRLGSIFPLKIFSKIRNEKIKIREMSLEERDKIVEQYNKKIMNIKEISDKERKEIEKQRDEFIKEFREEKSRGDNVRLIVDACQTVGRKGIDYYNRYDENAINPDAVFASCQKGFETSLSKTGFLVATDDFCRTYPDFVERDRVLQHGSEELSTIIQTAIACDPGWIREKYEYDEDIKRGIPDEVFDKLTVTPMERRQALVDLSKKFAIMVKLINKSKWGDRIEIINPDFKNLFDDKGKVNENALSGIFLFRIKTGGKYLVKERVNQISGKYGVSLEGANGPNVSGETIFRIAFNPFMGNDSVKILGRILEECAKDAYREEGIINQRNPLKSAIGDKPEDDETVALSDDDIEDLDGDEAKKPNVSNNSALSDETVVLSSDDIEVLNSDEAEMTNINRRWAKNVVN